MPRLSPALIRKANALNPLLNSLLKICRDLPSASNELRWLREHAYATHDRNGTIRREPSRRRSRIDAAATIRVATGAAVTEVATAGVAASLKSLRLKRLCEARGRGVPLQYLLGTEDFGGLELACAPQVLIPRPLTANIVHRLSQAIRAGIERGGAGVPRPLRVLDLCTGSGCMSFLLHTELARSCRPDGPAPTTTLGVDVSPTAVQLAKFNRARLGLRFKDSRGAWQSPLKFMTADVLGSAAPGNAHGQPDLMDRLDSRAAWRHWDVVVSNPPYISQDEFRSTQVEASVRRFEPRLALVPPSIRAEQSNGTGDGATEDRSRTLHDADLFYPRIVDVAEHVGAKVVVMEVGGPEQARRVQNMVQQGGRWDGVVLWRDETTCDERAVVCWRGEGGDWLFKKSNKSGNMSEKSEEKTAPVA